MLNLLIAIGVLCGSPAGKYPGVNSEGSGYYTSGKVLACQKTYITCIKKKVNSSGVPFYQLGENRLTMMLMDCVEEKK